MAATLLQVLQALRAPFVSVADGGAGTWTGTPFTSIAYPGVAFDPAAAGLSEWMEISIDAGQQRVMTVDEQYQGTPVLTIAAHTLPGGGQDRAVQLLDLARAMYAGQQFTAGTATLRAYSVSRMVELPKDGWFKLAIQISFRVLGA